MTSTDVNNHATLGIVCGAQVPKCEPARVASRRNVWGTRCERSDVSCETLCRCACALVDCVSKCVTKKQWQQAMRTRPWTNRRPSRGHPCGSVTVLMAVSTRGYSGGGLCERSSRAVVPRAGTAFFFLRLYTPLSNLGPAQLESRASHECAEALPVRDPAGPTPTHRHGPTISHKAATSLSSTPSPSSPTIPNLSLPS